MNVQNIPKKDKVVKEAFIPKQDALLFFDYKQIEYRLLAHYIGATFNDLSMAEVFRRGDDLHDASARAILGITDGRELTEAERDVGKTYNFLTIYGGGPYKASLSLGVSVDTARKQQAIFYAAWPSIKQLHNPARANGTYPAGEYPGVIQRTIADRATPERPGYITTLWGRHLRPDSPHKALNALVQGCAADLMRVALVKTHHWLEGNLFASHLVLTVHDELVIDAVEREIPMLVEAVPGLMDYGPVSAIVPIETDCEISRTTWAEKTPYEEANAGRPLVAA